MKRLFVALFVFSSSVFAQQQDPPNIILMIGDGMGLAQITAGMYSMDAPTALEDFPITGLSKTHSYNQFITDSAASGTAYACGEKTYNGVLGIDPKNNKLESIMEYCQSKGYQSALLATSSIVHATPAAFYANVPSRKQYQDIALQLSESAVDFFIGGGKKHFNMREDKRNLIKEMEKNDFEVVKNLDDYTASTAKRVGLFTNNDEPQPIAMGRQPNLAPAVNATLKKLNQKEAPFFMLVEGSQIDWGGHDNNLSYILSEFEDFNGAVAASLAFAKEDGNTLVIVTADHETGGLSLTKGNMKKKRISGEFSTKGHSGILVPVFAFGPNSESFTGIYDNTSIFKKMKALVN